MIKKELTQEDFSWVKWTGIMMKKKAYETLAYKKEVYEKVKNILPEERTFENTVLALDMSEGPHTEVFHFLSILGEVSPKKEIRDTINDILLDVSSKMVDLEYDRDLYISVLEYSEGNFSKEKKSLRKEDIKLLEESLREYKRAGFDKDDKMQTEIKKLLKKISKISQSFGKNLNDYTDYISCTEEELDGMSERFISSLPVDEKGKYMVTLAYPHLSPFLAEATNRKKRKELADKNLAKGGKKNLKIIEEIVSLRAELATLLGYAHHADFRTENRMAKTAKAVSEFQDELLAKVSVPTKLELKELQKHAKTLGLETLEYYDTAFVASSLKKKLYDIDPETLRAYFPLPHVLDELFALANTMFGIVLTPKEISLWHKDVLVYEVRNEKALGGDLVGYLALDLYPRDGKFGHYACAGTIETREVTYKSDEMVTPMAVIMGNFPSPQKKGKKISPALLSVAEVETMYHEFGHSLHHTLSKSKHMSFAGTNVAWDFVETPSQFMENFVWSKEALKKLSKHFETGESFEDQMIENIVGSKKFNNAYFFTRQLIQGKIDIDVHTGKTKDAKKAYIEMNKKYLGLTLPEDKTLFPAGFGHMVGYDAGYYSYLWALVYAYDAFSVFEKNKNDLRTVGMKWRKEVLEKGSSEDEMKLMKNFLGRSPNDKAFLKEVIGS